MELRSSDAPKIPMPGLLALTSDVMYGIETNFKPGRNFLYKIQTNGHFIT